MTSYTVKLEELIAQYCDSDDMLNNVPMRALFEVASLAEQQSQQQSKAEKTDKKARKQKIKEEIVIPEAPDFWSGPYYDSWLQSNVKVDGKSVKQFKTFEEAIELANKIEDCRGVVLTESGKYALRRGRTGVLYGGNYVCLASWVKGTNNPEPEPKRQPEPEPEPEPEIPSLEELEPAPELVPVTKTIETTDTVPTIDDGGGGGGGGIDATGGVRVVSGGPGPTVDIDYLYNFAKGLDQPFLATNETEDEDKERRYVYAAGGKVKKFGDGGLLGLTPEQTGIIGAAIGGIFGGLSGSGDTQGSQGYTGGIPALRAEREVVPGAFAMEGRRPGQGGRRYFTDVQYTPITDETGAPTILGAEQIAAQNEAALARQKEMEDLGRGILDIYSRAATMPDTTPATTTTTTEPAPVAPPATAFDTFITPYTAKDELTAEDYVTLGRSGYDTADMAASLGVTADSLQRVIDYYAAERLAGGGYLGGKGYYLGGPTDGMADQIPATINNIEPARLSDGEFVIPADVVSHLGNGNSDAGAQNLYSMMERVRRDRTGNPEQGRQIDPNKYLA